MSEQLVWIQRGESDPEQVRRGDVPPNFILGVLQGFGPCYINPRELKTVDEPRHGAFPDVVRERLAAIAETFSQVRPMSIEKWEHGFRCDTHPWQEIANWEHMADVFCRFTRHITGDDALSAQKRTDIFQLILSVINRGSLDGRRPRFKAPGTMTQNRADEIGGWLVTPENVALLGTRRNELRALIAPHQLIGPDRVNLEALFDSTGVGPNLSGMFSPLELVESAEVILGVDVNTGHEFLVFGRDLLQRVLATGTEEPAAVLRVALDQEDGDDLEKLVALVQVTKGRHDYRSSGDELA